MEPNFPIKDVRLFPAFVQSGTLNHDGKGYPYHRYLKRAFPKKFDFRGANDVGKTSTFASRKGNLPLDDDLQPTERLPRCIYVNPLKQVALNCVSLSGPGLIDITQRGIYQQKTEANIMSVMAADGETPAEKLEEIDNIGRVLKMAAPEFRASFGVENNILCPNTGLDIARITKKEVVLAHETIEQGRLLRFHLGDAVPIGLKVTPMMTVRTVKIIQDSGVYDYLMLSNTIPWLELPDLIDWKKLFGSEISPLNNRGFKQPGGLSGWPLLPIVEMWIREARAYGITMIIIAGGGILYPDDINRLDLAGADAYSIGSVTFLRPWNVQPIIQRIHQIHARRMK